MDSTASLRFEINNNFNLIPVGWGEAVPMDIARLLDSVTTEFHTFLDMSEISVKPVIVLHSSLKVPFTDTPEIRKFENFTAIYLACDNNDWCRYSYQFSHELCHHVVDTPFFNGNDKFGWFEEALCELTSIFVMIKMSSTWQINAPYPNWKGYANSLYSYANNILAQEDATGRSFKTWLISNIEELEKHRYKRLENRIIAINLFPVFNQQPILWHTIHYLHKITVTDEMELQGFLHAWKAALPEYLIEDFRSIEEIFI